MDAGTAATTTTTAATAITTATTGTATTTATATTATSVRDRSRRVCVMDSELRTWDLYELSGAVNPDTLEAMRALFRRFRGLRQKGIEGVEYGALQESWCAFVRRWNRMKEAGEDFVAWLNHLNYATGSAASHTTTCTACATFTLLKAATLVLVSGPLKKNGARTSSSDRTANTRIAGSNGIYVLSPNWLDQLTSPAHVGNVLSGVALRRCIVGSLLATDVLDHVPVDAYVDDLILQLVVGDLNPVHTRFGPTIGLGKRRLVVSNNVWNIPEEIGSRLPRIVLRREAKPVDPIASSNRGRPVGTTASRCSRRILVCHDIVNNPADITSSVNNGI
ncbi:hypothetical protein F441_18074 [Phytophthora nicotianae CJ01A1]|uniref:Uncharacterized protein n=1 Tax=Phytophthora nicotianae CJ01A1 TaxID=1317063 RepID=W2W5N7_PHYNI|nr:hypothetical protein F441_18074 [Phytophthora nicotianae CJ01A1]